MEDTLFALGVMSAAVPLLASQESGDSPMAELLRAASLKLRWQLPEIGCLDLLLSAYPGSLAERGEKAARRAGAIAGKHVRLLRREKDPLCPVLWQTPDGKLWGRFIDGELLNYVASEMYDDPTYKQGGISFREGEVVVDLGGHLGLLTGYVLAHWAGRVVVFEADPRKVVCLRKSFANEIEEGRVAIVEAAAWSEPTELTFATAGEADNSSVSQLSKNGNVKVKATTIDQVTEDVSLDRVDFIKMDIEGAERETLLGARSSLEKHKPQMALSIYHINDDPQVIVDLTLAAVPDYQVVRHTEQACFVSPSQPQRSGGG